MIGIQEASLSFPKERFEQLDESCQKDCPYKYKVPNCSFMINYYEYLKTLDFDKMLKEFEHISEDVKKINHFEGDPEIVLLVYEAASCECAERPCLQKWFKDNGYELKEWKRTVN